MNIGQAVIEFMPTLPPTAVSTMTLEAGKAGTQAGKSLSDSFDRAARLPDVVVKVVTAAAERSIQSVKDKLSLVRDKTVNIDVDASGARGELSKLNSNTRVLASSMIALGPAAVPAMGAIAVSALGIGAAVGSGIAALGLFGAAVSSVFGEVKKQQDKIDTQKAKLASLDQEIDKYKALGKDTTALDKERAKILENINAQYAQMTPGVRQVSDSYEALKGSWQSFIASNGPAVYGTMTKVMDTLSISIGKLQPLFDVGAAAAGKLADQFQNFVSGGSLDRLVAFISTNAGPALNNMGAIAKNLGTLLVNIFKDVVPSGQGFLAWLNEATAKLASWSSGNGLQKFMEYLTSNGPTTGKFLADIAGAAVKLAQAVTPLAPVTLAIASGLAALIHALPVPVLTTIVGLFVAYNTALVAYNTYTGIAAAATKVWAAIQWVLNAAMSANPIGIVVVAIAALVAAIVIAYKNSETFRNIVQAVWSAIKTAIGAVADWFVKTVWPAMKSAISALGTVFTWLNTNIIQPVWSAIKIAIQVAWTVIQALFVAGQAYIRALAAVFTWLWQNVINPVWQGIKLAIQIAWVAIQIIFKTIEIAIKALALVFQWLWNNVIVPVWNGIKTATSLWWTGMKIIFDTVIGFIKTVFSAVFTWLWHNVIEPVWSAIKKVISLWWDGVKTIFNTVINFLKSVLGPAWETAKSVIITAWNAIKGPIESAWTWIKDHVFNPIKDFITKTIPNAFSTGVSAIGKAWDKIKEYASVPVKFVVNTVINDGIIKGFNWIADKVGVSPISPIHLNFADGGVLPGYTPGKDVHRFVSPTGGVLDLSGGEAILRPELTKALGPAFIHAANSAARNGSARNFLKRFAQYGNHPQFANGGVLAFKDGGILGGIVGGISKAWDAFTNPVETFKNAVNGLMGGMPGGPFIKDVLHGTIGKMVDGVAAWITSKFNSSAGGLGAAGGPGNWQAMWNWVHSRFPQAQLFSGLRNTQTLSGNTSLHAFGRAIDVSPIREIALAIKNTFGKNVTELITPWPELDLWHGAFHDYSPALDAQHGVGSAGNDHVHWAMKLGGVLKRFGLFDQGGWLNSGGIAVNMSRKPEAVLTADESAGLKAMGTDKLVDLLHELIEAVRDVAPGVGSHIRGSGRGLITKARGV